MPTSKGATIDRNYENVKRTSPHGIHGALQHRTHVEKITQNILVVFKRTLTSNKHGTLVHSDAINFLPESDTVFK